VDHASGAGSLEQTREAGEVREQRVPLLVTVGGGIGGDDPGGARDAGLDQAGEVDVAEEPAAERPGTVAPGQVVAEQAGPDVGVDVQIDDVAGRVERRRLPRDAEVAHPPSRRGGIGGAGPAQGTGHRHGRQGRTALNPRGTRRVDRTSA
jgi:hypothetical protein